MADDPYRKGRAPSEELARLAAQGQQRIEAARRSEAQAHEALANQHLREAIGAIRGSLIGRICLALLLLMIGIGVGGALVSIFATQKSVKSSGGTFYFIGLVGWIPALIAYLFVGSRASLAQIERERRWVGALPFRLDGYFEVLSAEPAYECNLKVDLEWEGTGVDTETLQGVVGRFDPEAKVTSDDPHRATFVTGAISGATSMRVNRALVLRNHRVGWCSGLCTETRCFRGFGYRGFERRLTLLQEETSPWLGWFRR
jgi:hypothetical protein